MAEEPGDFMKADKQVMFIDCNHQGRPWQHSPIIVSWHSYDTDTVKCRRPYSPTSVTSR